jgi:hypothetical protein
MQNLRLWSIYPTRCFGKSPRVLWTAKVALYDVLLERQQADSLDSNDQERLACLRQEADVLMLRKAHAYTLLQSRGHELPSLQELCTLTL